jgi:hypothetical protein
MSLELEKRIPIYWERNGEIKQMTEEGRFVFINFLRGNYWPSHKAYPIVITQCGCFYVHTINIEHGVPLQLKTYTVYEWRPTPGYIWSEIKIFKGFPIKGDV